LADWNIGQDCADEGVFGERFEPFWIGDNANVEVFGEICFLIRTVFWILCENFGLVMPGI
jgi:hypothetical protein